MDEQQAKRIGKVLGAIVGGAVVNGLLLYGLIMLMFYCCTGGC